MLVACGCLEIGIWRWSVQFLALHIFLLINLTDLLPLLSLDILYWQELREFLNKVGEVTYADVTRDRNEGYFIYFSYVYIKNWFLAD